MTSSRSHSARAAGLTLLVALSAGATKPGEPLHVGKSPARLLNIPSIDGQVLKTLPPGTKVLWRSSAKDKGFEFVTANGLPGFVLTSDLVAQPPPPSAPRQNSELRAATRDGEIDPFSPDLSLNGPGPGHDPGPDPLRALEEANDRAATEAAITAHAKAARLKVGKR